MPPRAGKLFGCRRWNRRAGCNRGSCGPPRNRPESPNLKAAKVELGGLAFSYNSPALAIHPAPAGVYYRMALSITPEGGSLTMRTLTALLLTAVIALPAMAQRPQRQGGGMGFGGPPTGVALLSS